MQSVTPLYVSSVLPRFSDCSLVFITETHTHTQSSGEYTPFTVHYIAVPLLPLLTIDGVDRDGRCAPRKAA